jgi:hypothetical protein
MSQLMTAIPSQQSAIVRPWPFTSVPVVSPDIGTTSAMTRSPADDRPLVPRSQLVHDACHVDTGYVGRIGAGQLFRPAAGAEREIRRVDRHRMDPDPPFRRARSGTGQDDDAQKLGGAEFGEPDGLHHMPLFLNAVIPDRPGTAVSA